MSILTYFIAKKRDTKVREKESGTHITVVNHLGNIADGKRVW